MFTWRNLLSGRWILHRSARHTSPTPTYDTPSARHTVLTPTYQTPTAPSDPSTLLNASQMAPIEYGRCSYDTCSCTLGQFEVEPPENIPQQPIQERECRNCGHKFCKHKKVEEPAIFSQPETDKTKQTVDGRESISPGKVKTSRCFWVSINVCHQSGVPESKWSPLFYPSCMKAGSSTSGARLPRARPPSATFSRIR
jgi:hypothetical protein